MIAETNDGTVTSHHLSANQEGILFSVGKYMRSWWHSRGIFKSTDTAFNCCLETLGDEERRLHNRVSSNNRRIPSAERKN